MSNTGVKFATMEDFQRMVRAVKGYESTRKDASGKTNVPSMIPLPQPGTLFRVSLSKTGGSDGTQTTAASWVYTATTIVGSVTLGTGLSPERPRPNGMMAFASAGYGYFGTSGTFVLADAFETPGTRSGAC